MSLTSAFEPLRTRWAGLPGREKNGVRLAVLLVLAFLLWQFSVAP
ncbi:MAG: type II secretion system protein M, partial [Burkholderiales bacterium]|nr:type II secretion system protein M [Burkholderiales bacterium]